LTSLLRRWGDGEEKVVGELLPLVYDELLRIARRQFRREREDHTLEPTALVHEVFLRLTGGQAVQWQNRTHFFRLAASLMRRTLVDHARSHGRQKRGGGELRRLPLEAMEAPSGLGPEDLLALNQALEALERFDPVKARIVELRFFGGLSMAETGHCVGLSERSVWRHWRHAKLILFQQLAPEFRHAF
jgi:RNA polymerase sigma factor (TIGR02999 family)